MIPGLFPGRRNLERILEKSMIKASLTEDKGARCRGRERERRVLGKDEEGTGSRNVEMRERGLHGIGESNPIRDEFLGKSRTF